MCSLWPVSVWSRSLRHAHRLVYGHLLIFFLLVYTSYHLPVRALHTAPSLPPSPSPMDHDMSTMDMSGSSSSSMTMTMVFTNTHDKPLFSSAWTPSSSGTYAGTCIFLIVLAIIGRCLIAFKATMERHWLATHLNRRYVAIAGKTSEAGRIDVDPDAKTASLITAQGVEENVKVVRNISTGPIPWRFSVDVPRAALFLCIAGVSYLLYVLSRAELGEFLRMLIIGS
ncbi:Ctr copper transporter [Penicillium canariense]|uniref:Copper transport protein n=1 Tax=Penicillium canariense TaxID=189055 RepID=A0A9W9LML3_9EURO|nr:Ctr copper transporter [Penicillium canariense]KAJ5166226.1 Ctr copper transporter [Penicillium canariense]